MNLLDKFNARVAEKVKMVTQEEALKGRGEAMQLSAEHFVLKTSIKAPFPEDSEQLVLGLGCFWGAEKKFWSETGIYATAVGYSGGYTPNPTYEEVCTGKTGHNEVVLVVYKPQVLPLARLLKLFWESHDPTQGMRQGNDVGTQYRSGIYFNSQAQKEEALKSLASYQKNLSEKGFGEISTEILPASEFYYAEEYHQQYLAKNPNGYCGLGGTGVNADS